MSNVVMFMTKKLEISCSSKNIKWSTDFSDQINNTPMSKQKMKRMVNYFVKTPPQRLLSSLLRRGYSYDQALTSLFSRRFGKYLVLYRFRMLSGKLGLVLMKIIQLITKHLHTIATHFSKIAEGGEVMYFNMFEIYACEPVLCVDPILE